MEMGERVTALEIKMDDLTGNGQPGRMKLAEDNIKELEKFMWRVLGALGCLTVLTGAIEGLHVLRDMGVLKP